MEKFKNILQSRYMLIPLSLVVVLCWALNVPLISITFIGVYFILSMCFCDNFKLAYFPLFVLPYIFTTQDLNYYFQNMVYLIILLLLLIASTIYFVVRQVKQNKKKFKKGFLFWGLIATLICNVFAGLFSSQFNIMISFLTLVVCLLLFGIYLLAVNFSEGDNKKELCYAFLCVCGVVMAEMLISAFQTGNLIEAITNKKLRVGIDEINAAATLLGVGIPLCFYLAMEEGKKRYLWYGLITILYIFIIMSCSRGALLMTTIVLIAVLIYYIVKCKGKKEVLTYLFSVIGVCLILFIAFNSKIIELFSWYLKKGFDDSGRFEIYELCFDLFKKNPVFGVGYVTEYVVVPGTDILITHSTLLQIMTSLGCVGIIAYMIYYYQRYAVLFKAKNAFGICVMFGLLVAELYGLIDTFCLNIFLIMVFYIFSAECEKDLKVKVVTQNEVEKEDDVETYADEEVVKNVELEIWGRKFTLDVEYNCYEGEYITESQVQLLEMFINNPTWLENSKKDVENYCKNDVLNDEENQKKDNIFSYIKPECVFIKHCNQPKLAILCKYRYDQEHGLAVVFDNSGNVVVGLQDIIL